jgi:hypothetical protein
VEDHPRAWIAGGDGIAQCPGHEFGTQVIGHRLADDAAEGDVDHGH